MSQEPIGLHPNLQLLSASSQVLLHTCPRKFQLYRLMKALEGEQEGQHHLDFGHWVGEGIQQYLVSSSKEAAIMAMFLYKGGDPFEEDEKAVRDNKTFWHALIALDKFITLRSSELQHFEVVTLSGKPAVELGFILDCIGGFTYRGFLDGLLYNKVTKELTVLECKTSKFKQVNDAQYKNSGQGLGYSLVVDAITKQLQAEGLEVASSWKVMYPIWLAGAAEWDIKTFHKSSSQRARWLMNLITDIGHIGEFAEADHFPMHGESCFSFFRQCEYFELCEMSDKMLIGAPSSIKLLIDDPTRYTFRFSMEDLIVAQQAKIA